MEHAPSALLGCIMLLQAVALLAISFVTFWWAEDWMLMLIHLVGEERALGSDSVITTAEGGKLLTNPDAMMKWTIPFWLSALVELSAAITLFVQGWARLNQFASR